MRLALTCALCLVLASGLAAQATSGYLAQGKVTLTTPRGVLSGSITVAAAAPNLCKVAIDLGSAVSPRRLAAVFDGTTAVVRGPALLLHAAPLAVSPGIGCALLAPRVAMAGPVLATVSGTAHLEKLTWTRGPHTLALRYGYASPSDALPSSVVESVDGVTRVSIRYDTIAAHVFEASDFASSRPGVGTGGGQ